MKQKDGKYCFWQTPGLFGLIIFTEILFLTGFFASLIMAIKTSPYMYVLAAIFGTIFILLLIAGFRLFFLRVEIDAERIVVKGIFGILTECKIIQIKNVYFKHFFKEGYFIIIKDDKQRKGFVGFASKDCYVRFSHTKEREKIVRSFWTGEIFESAWDDDSVYY